MSEPRREVLAEPDPTCERKPRPSGRGAVTDAMAEAAMMEHRNPRSTWKTIVQAALAAAPSPWRPIAEYDPKIEPYGFVLCDIRHNHRAVVARGSVADQWWTDTGLNAVERPQRFMPLPKLERP